MVTPQNLIDIQHGGCEIGGDSIFVEGVAPAGAAAYLSARRYRKQPEWWVIDVASVPAPTDHDQRFRLSCAVASAWGTAGIEIVGPESSLRIERPSSHQPVVETLGGGTRLVRSSPADDANRPSGGTQESINDGFADVDWP